MFHVDNMLSIVYVMKNIIIIYNRPDNNKFKSPETMTNNDCLHDI